MFCLAAPRSVGGEAVTAALRLSGELTQCRGEAMPALVVGLELVLLANSRKPNKPQVKEEVGVSK